MATYLDNIQEYTNKAIKKIAELRSLLSATEYGSSQRNILINKINWYWQLVSGANDTNQTDELRLRLLTLLVDNARLNDAAPVDIINLYQPILPVGPSGSVLWGLITGNINDQLDLIAKFNTYLPLAGGTMTGNIIFDNNLGINTASGQTLRIGESSGTVRVGASGNVVLGTITAGMWNGSNIGVAKGGLGGLDFSAGTDGQAIIKSGAGYAFYTIPAIPSLTGYIKADGTVAMTANLNFAANTGIDTSAAGQLRIGQTNATSVRIYQPLTVSTIVSGSFQGTPVGLPYGGTGAPLTAPAAGQNRVMFFDGTTETVKFVSLSSNFGYNSGTSTISIANTTGLTWNGNAIPIPLGGSGQTALGSALQVLRTNAGATGTEWATLTALTNPMTTLGDIIYGGASGTPTRLAGNTVAQRQFLISEGDGTLATAPVWGALISGDIPTISISQVSGLSTALANKLGNNLAQGKIYIGNVSDLASPQTPYGDWTIAVNGLATISNNAVTFAKFQQATGPQQLIGTPDIAGAQNFRIITIDPSTLQIDNLGVMSVIGGGGGGGTPGGTNGEFQWNNSGSFDGMSRLITDGSSVWAQAANFFLADDAATPTNTINFDISAVAGSRLWTFPDGNATFVGLALTQTLTNKTISGASNTLTNIANASLVNSAVTINGTAVSLGASATITAATTNALTVGTGLQLNTGTTFDGSAARTISIDSTVATLTGSQALTNKTVNGLTLTALATGFSIAGGTTSKTLTMSNTLTFTGTDSSSVAFGAGGTVAYVGLANSWTSGIKQTFAPSATTAGINVGSLAGQPSSPANGDMVYNTSANALQAYINGAWVSLGAGGGGSSALSAITAATGTNTINNATFAQEWQWNTLAGATGFRLSSTSTAAASNAQTLFAIALSGANGTSTQTTYGATVSNTHTGTSSTNVALQLTASGGTNNYALITTAGLVGFGLTAPTGLVHISGATASIPHLILAASAITPSLATNGAMWYNTVSSNSTLNLYKDTGYTKFITLDRNPDLTGAAQAFITADTAGTLGRSGDITALGIFMQTSTVTVANTAASTSLLGTLVGSSTLPANFFGSGKTIRIFVTGALSTTTGSQSVDILLSIGGVAVGTITLTHGTSLSGVYWDAEFILTCRTTGASGTLQYVGQAKINHTSGSALSFFQVSTTSGAINTTGTLAIDLRADWVTADPSNSISASVVTAEYLN